MNSAEMVSCSCNIKVIGQLLLSLLTIALCSSSTV